MVRMAIIWYFRYTHISINDRFFSFGSFGSIGPGQFSEFCFQSSGRWRSEETTQTQTRGWGVRRQLYEHIYVYYIHIYMRDRPERASERAGGSIGQSITVDR